MFVSVARIKGEPYLRSSTVTMPAYHRLAFDDPHLQMQYHLAGYGRTNEEALTRLTGEGVERYAAMMSMKVFESKLEYHSHRDLVQRGETCVPLNLIGILDEKEQARLGMMMPRFSKTPPTNDDVIAWVSCPSLTRPGENVYVPAQLMFLGFRTDSAAGDKMFTPSFSTGTAAHVTLDQALMNAIIEAVQIDAFIINWYTGTPAPRLELDSTCWSLLESTGLTAAGPYEVRATYLTRPELPLPNIGVTLVRKDTRLPYIAFGLQADADPHYALMRGGAEAAAILAIGAFSTIFDLPRVHFAENGSAFTDLDTNVLYFASPRNAATKEAAVSSRVSGSVNLSDLPSYGDSADSIVRRLIRDIAQVSEYASYLDITPPELADTPWRVVRVLIPELLSMCLPGLPANVHPRMQSYGGVTHVAPHPLP